MSAHDDAGGAPEGHTGGELAGGADGVDDGFVPVPRRDVVVEELEGELVLLDGASGQLRVLNAPAAVVWRCLDGRVDVATVAADLAAHFEADPDRVRRDVLGLVRQLVADGLVASPGEGPAPGGDAS